MSTYIFLGPELGKKQDAINNAKNKIKNRNESEEYIFYADETPAFKIIETLQNQGLFADSRIIIVKNSEAFKKKDDIELLVSWTKDTKLNDENNILILLSEENRIAAGFDNARAIKQVFYEMFENEKTAWLKDFFSRQGFKIDDDCIDTILELVENNTEALKRECSRLISFLKSQDNQTDGISNYLSVNEVEKWLSHNRDESAFTLFSRIAAGDLSKALESLSVMLSAKESAAGILSGLTWCFRKLNDYLSLAEAGNSDNAFELKKIGLSSPKSKADYFAASRQYNSESVETCLALTAQYDVLLRSPVAVMEKILMDRYILSLINTGNKS